MDEQSINTEKNSHNGPQGRMANTDFTRGPQGKLAEPKSFRVDSELEHDSTDFFAESKRINDGVAETPKEEETDRQKALRNSELIEGEDGKLPYMDMSQEIPREDEDDVKPAGMTRGEVAQMIEQSKLQEGVVENDLPFVSDPEGGTGAHTIESHSDVTLTSPTNYQSLTFSTDPSDIGDSGLDHMWINDFARWKGSATA